MFNFFSKLKVYFLSFLSLVREKFVFSPFLKTKSYNDKLAYMGLVTAFLVVCNTFLEFRMLDIQYSVTIFFCLLSGIILGSISGFCSCVIADIAGYFLNSFGQLFMPWVSLSTGCFALISGIVFAFYKNSYVDFYIKALIVTLTSFIVCTVFINSLGFYIYNYKMGFSFAVINYVKTTFQKDVSFVFYCVYRLIFKGQILNSVFNYILFFLSFPLLNRLGIFKNSN